LIAESTHVQQRLRGILALWFVLQIALPFTAPLQTCDLRDFLGTTHQHGAPASPESTTTPLAGEADSAANAFVSPLAASSLRASTSLASVRPVAISRPFLSTLALSPSPQVQQTVLRV
jgi:hypothetical protein